MRNLLLAILMFTPIFTFAQNNDKAAHKSKVVNESLGRPDVPGDFIIEFGASYFTNTPDRMKQKIWGSKFFNAYYFYNKNIGKSNFSVHPGLGISTDKFAFNGPYSLINEGGSVRVIHVDTLLNNNVRTIKSKIASTFVEVPVELRWRLLKYDPKRSFKVAIGGKIGYRVGSHTKIKYTDGGGSTKVFKSKEDFELNKLRYGVYSRVGIGNFYLNYYYSLSTYFNKDKGPEAVELTPMYIGIAINLF